MHSNTHVCAEKQRGCEWKALEEIDVVSLNFTRMCENWLAWFLFFPKHSSATACASKCI